MDWISIPFEEYADEKELLRKLDKFTLYEHNYTSEIDFDHLSFTCAFNCKRLNRVYSILGKIQGDLLSKNIQINCALIDLNKFVSGRWHHQKIQLTRFAYRYNEKAANMSTVKATSEEPGSYQIKVNPLSGEFYVCFHFFVGDDLIKDYEKLRMKLTDECQRLGDEAEKIFNTIIEVIFDQEANDPYLKSDERVGMHFSRPVKVSKLLKKIKKLNTISNHYKIRQDIAEQCKLRSLFKKVYLRRTQKSVHNPLIIDTAMVYVPKFCKKHYDALAENATPAKKNNQMISPFEDLDDNHEAQFAKHLIQNYVKNSPILNLMLDQEDVLRLCQAKPGVYVVKDGLELCVEYISEHQKLYEEWILKKINFKHPNIIQYYSIFVPDQTPFRNLRITENFPCMELTEYLRKFGATISLSTRLSIMSQICQVMVTFHRNSIGYFIDIRDIFITEGNVIKIKNFTTAYSICSWDEVKPVNIKNSDFNKSMQNFKDFIQVCGRRSEDLKMKEKKKDDQDIKKLFENEKADVYSLGMALYLVLMDKFPFSPNCIAILQSNPTKIDEFFNQIWVVETQFFMRQGGMIVKLLGQLLLKCLHMETDKRPFVEWISLILSEVSTSLEGIY